jgi:hypothetical protein
MPISVLLTGANVHDSDRSGDDLNLTEKSESKSGV